MTVTKITKRLEHGPTLRAVRDITEIRPFDEDWDWTKSPSWKQYRIGEMHYFVDENEVSLTEFRNVAISHGLMDSGARDD